MNKTNKVRKGEVRIYEGKTYVAIPEIKEDHCTGCCFYNEGCCSIRDFDHIDFPDCHNSGMIWMQKEIVNPITSIVNPSLFITYLLDFLNPPLG